MTDTEQTPATEAATATKKVRSPRSLAGIYVNTPQVLRSALEAEAKAGNVSVASLVRDKLATVYGLTLPAAKIRTKYASAEEKAAARKQSNKSRGDLMSRLMGIHRIKQQALAKGEELTDVAAGVIWDAQTAERIAKAAEKAAAKAATEPVAA